MTPQEREELDRLLTTKVGIAIIDAKEMGDSELRTAIEDAEAVYETVIVVRYEDVDIEGSRVHVI